MAHMPANRSTYGSARTAKTLRMNAARAMERKSRNRCHGWMAKSGCQSAIRLGSASTLTERKNVKRPDVRLGEGEEEGECERVDVPGDETRAEHRRRGGERDPASRAVPAGEEGECVLPSFWCKDVWRSANTQEDGLHCSPPDQWSMEPQLALSTYRPSHTAPH